MGPRAPGLPLLVLLALGAAAGEAPVPAPLELARMYAAGQRSQALARLDGWDEADFRRDWEGLREVRNARAGLLPEAELRAAILLHTDRAALERELLPPVAREGACDDHPHRAHARSMAIALMAQSHRAPEHERTRAFVQRWITAMALDAQRYGCFAAVRSWTEQGAEWFPAAAVFRLLRATAVETEARLEGQAYFGRPGMGSWPSRSRAAERASWRQRLFAAVDDLRSALELDPGLDEARLRLGRLQWQLGRAREARATLEALLARARGSAERYLGHLFLGRVLEDAGDRAAALGHYRQALELDPAAQAAAVAIAHGLLVEGDLGGSRDLLRHALKQAPRDEPRDGWLSYNIGRSGQYEGLLQALRAEVSR